MGAAFDLAPFTIDEPYEQGPNCRARHKLHHGKL